MCQEGGPQSPLRANFASMVFGPGATSRALDVSFLRNTLRRERRCVRTLPFGSALISVEIFT